MNIEQQVTLDPRRLEDFLRQFVGQEVFYLPNGGNAGDSLIAAATYQTFDRIGLKPSFLKNMDEAHGKTVILAGGGNLVPYYADMRQALGRLLDRGVGRIIVLPHTIRAHENLLRRLPANTVIFCRDPVSYTHVIENTDATVYLDHDMAFYLCLEEFDRIYHPAYGDTPALFANRRPAIDAILAETHGEGRFFRKDDESARLPLPQGPSVDLATLFEFGTWPTNAEKAVNCIFRALRACSRVVTDRLHMGIACGLLGVECELFDNIYGKNRGIYFHSLKRFCHSVKFVMAEAQAPVQA